MKKATVVKKIVLPILGAVCLFVVIWLGRKALISYEAVSYPVYGFANMRGTNGQVYRGIGGAYGEKLPLEASTFTIRDDKLYYAGQIKEDFVVSEERTGTICEASLDGLNSRVLVEDAYNLGFGQEKLIGDKLFYPNGLDEEYNTTYAWYDLQTGEKQKIQSSRINNIFGYDGTCLFYGGFDAKKGKNIVGKYNLSTNKEKTLFSYGSANEQGDIISLYYYQEKIYAVTLMEEMKEYDARTAVYDMVEYSADNGKMVGRLPLSFTGSANYGFLYDEADLYFSTAQELCHVCLTQEEGEKLTVTSLATLLEKEYWGIPHFVPKDGYLYYEAVADIDEETSMNDYFYRVPIEGGEPELLASWFTS